MAQATATFSAVIPGSPSERPGMTESFEYATRETVN
jgi:hypothetical protein